MKVINYFIPSSGPDVVAVYDQNFNQVFPKARIVKPVIKPSSKGMEHPIETGVIITDHVIINPIELELPVIVKAPDLQDTYKTIFNYYTNSTLLNIHTKAGVYPNMYILEMPHEEDPDLFDAIAVVLKFKQALIVTSQSQPNIQPKDPKHSSTVKRGNVQPVTPAAGTTALQDLAAAAARIL